MSEHIAKMKEIGLKVKEVKATNSKVKQMIKKICTNDMRYEIEPSSLFDRCIEICLVAEVDCEYIIDLKEQYEENNDSNLINGCKAFLNACVV